MRSVVIFALFVNLTHSAEIMATTQRHLVNLDMILSDIELMSPEQYASEQHVTLLKSVLNILAGLALTIQEETVHSFQQAVESAGLQDMLKDKRMVTIYQRLISNVLEFWSASQKIRGIIDAQFDDHADERLTLLQAKAMRAKNQFKTVATAMGMTDYLDFLHRLGLEHSDWRWPK